MHPLFVLDGEVERRRPQLVVRVLGLEHGLQQRKLRFVEVQQRLLAVDGLDVGARCVQFVRHSSQHLHVVTHLLRARYLTIYVHYRIFFLYSVCFVLPYGVINK